MTLSGKPLQEHVQQLCRACFLKAAEEGPDPGQAPRGSDRIRSNQKKDIPNTKTRQQEASVITARQRDWKQIEDANAKVSFYLTGESVVRAATIPTLPGSKTPVVVRVTHSNVYGRVDSDVYVRLGDPKKPLNVQDFDTVSDWRKAELVEDLLWSDKREKWVLKSKAGSDTSVWSGTYDIEIQFPKGYHQIELKIISRVPGVCSIVLSNWKVYVR